MTIKFAVPSTITDRIVSDQSVGNQFAVELAVWGRDYGLSAAVEALRSKAIEVCNKAQYWSDDGKSSG